MLYNCYKDIYSSFNIQPQSFKERTAFGKELFFVSGMEGRVDIVTEDRSLPERFLPPVKKVWTEHFKAAQTSIPVLTSGY